MDLLERRNELNALDGALTDALAGRGRLAVVEGVAGSGKSTLLSALKARAGARGVRVLSARGGEFERGFAFGAIRQLFDKPLADADAAGRERILAGAAAPAAAALSADPADAPAVPGAQVLHAIYWLATNLALVAPLLIVVDDLHWADGSSVLALSYLGRRVADLPVALVVAMRPDEPGTPVELVDDLRSSPDAITVSLSPLGRDSVYKLVRDAVPGAGEAICAACYEASAGNPLYLRELLRTVTADADGPLGAEAVKRAALPAMGDRVLRRIARLGPEAPPLARAMAVLGDGGRLADAAALAGMDEASAAPAAAAMARIEILASADPFEFVHPLVRRSVYDSMTVTERDDAHLGAGRLMRARGASSEVVAAHLGSLRPAGSTEIATALDLAAGDALARGASGAAVLTLRRALAEKAPEPPRADLLHRLGRLLALQQDLGAIDPLEEALELSQEPSRRAEIAIDLSALYALSGRWQPAVEVISMGIADLGTSDPALAVHLEALRGVVAIHDSNLAGEFDQDWARLRGLADGESWGARALAALLSMKAAARGDRTEDVVALAELALRDWVLIDQPGAGGWAAGQCVGALIMMEADRLAVAALDRMSAVARRDGLFTSVIYADGFRAWHEVRHGELAIAEALVAPLLDSAVQAGMSMGLTTGVFFTSDLLLERTQLSAIAELVESFEMDPSFLPTASGAMLLHVRGRLRAARGERAAAVDDLRAAGEIFSAIDFGPTYSPWRTELALALPPDRRDEALALAAEEVELAAATGLARPHGVALRAVGLLASGDGIEPLRRSVELLADSPARLEHARSLVELGSALRRRGQRAEARDPLADGRELAHRCGADRTVARATEELAASGARPRRIARTGIEALTPSERRVAGLVTEGRSNTEVAQELLVSLKTVETHLSRVYAKFGLAGPGARRHLQHALTQRS